jgi:hypothetical protein
LSTHIDGSQANGIDPCITETEYLVYHEALQNRAPSNQVVQRALRDLNKYKCELLKLGELKPLENAVGEVAVFDGGNA